MDRRDELDSNVENWMLGALQTTVEAMELRVRMLESKIVILSTEMRGLRLLKLVVLKGQIGGLGAEVKDLEKLEDSV